LIVTGPTGKGGTVNWHEVAKRVPGRDNKDCRKRYYNEHDGAVKKGTWSKNEDVRLEGLVREHGTQWAVVARRMETRSADRTSSFSHVTFAGDVTSVLGKRQAQLTGRTRVLETMEPFAETGAEAPAMG
jgi:hypothetical protein